MDRRKFLARFGLGAIGAVVATKVVVEVAEKPEIKPIEKLPEITAGKGWIDQIRESGNYVLYTDRNGLKAFNEAIDKSNPAWWEQHVHVHKSYHGKNPS